MTYTLLGEAAESQKYSEEFEELPGLDQNKDRGRMNIWAHFFLGDILLSGMGGRDTAGCF